MRAATILICLFILPLISFAQTAKQITGEGIEGGFWRYENFPSKFVAARNIDVWLPPQFSKNKKYPVLYMHDGQMLFDGKSTWNKQEWMIDETMTKLIAENKIREAIVVGIWNTPQRREEYMPQKAFAMATAAQKAEAAKFGIAEVFSDRYLKFIVEELKPFIDKTYPTLKDRKNTFVMGSSMGGLISLYAISEYPEIFGGAACISTHFPAGDGVMIEYMKTNLPAPKDHKIYFDYGTETLDASYEPFQIKADAAMKAKGYEPGKNWLTRKFAGEDHSERAWAKRAEIPLVFLLGK
jgi:predicted alpha/beta superfamily hydrolase